MKIEFEPQKPTNYVHPIGFENDISLDVGIMDEQDVKDYLKKYEEEFRKNWLKRKELLKNEIKS